MSKSSKPEKKQETPESRQKDLQNLKERLKAQYRLKRLLERIDSMQCLPTNGGSDTAQMMQQAQQERTALKDKDLH